MTDNNYAAIIDIKKTDEGLGRFGWNGHFYLSQPSASTCPNSKVLLNSQNQSTLVAK